MMDLEVKFIGTAQYVKDAYCVEVGPVGEDLVTSVAVAYGVLDAVVQAITGKGVDTTHRTSRSFVWEPSRSGLPYYFEVAENNDDGR